MFDARKLLDQMMGAAETYVGKDNIDKVRQGIANNPGMTKAAGIGLAAVLLGTRSGRAIGTSALKLGGLAAIGGLAYKAYNDYQRSKSGAVVQDQQAGHKGELPAPPAGSSFEHRDDDAQDRARAFLGAMIAAAKADGSIDADEQKRIFGKLNEMVDGAEAKAFLMEQMMAPLDIDKVVAQAGTHEQAVELYAASAMAIVADTPSEKLYLETLAEKLKLDRELVKLVDKAIAEERAAT